MVKVSYTASKQREHEIHELFNVDPEKINSEDDDDNDDASHLHRFYFLLKFDCVTTLIYTRARHTEKRIAMAI